MEYHLVLRLQCVELIVNLNEITREQIKH